MPHGSGLWPGHPASLTLRFLFCKGTVGQIGASQKRGASRLLSREVTGTCCSGRSVWGLSTGGCREESHQQGQLRHLQGSRREVTGRLRCRGCRGLGGRGGVKARPRNTSEETLRAFGMDWNNNCNKSNFTEGSASDPTEGSTTSHITAAAQ